MDKWAFSSDGELYTDSLDTKDDAIAEGKKAYPDKAFWVGKCEKPRAPSSFIDGQDIIEIILVQDEYGREFCGSWANDVFQASIHKETGGELTRELSDVVRKWIQKHQLEPTFFTIDQSTVVQIN